MDTLDRGLEEGGSSEAFTNGEGCSRLFSGGETQRPEEFAAGLVIQGT